jgi:Holliday junction DNA helicase RuvA
MIGRLTGDVIECKPDHVMLDVAGVGYYLQIPLSTYYGLCEQPESRATLQVHTHVREDALSLFGFITQSEKETFELLIAISGIGPRVALAFLSGIGVDELHESIRVQDRARLQKIPGVGKKTAERVLLELKDRVAAGRRVEGDPGRAGDIERPGTGRGERVEIHEDAISALVNLGYAPEIARRAVDAAQPALTGEITLEGLLKAVLGRLAGG